jgi:class 3 adenylate cyclase
METTEPEIRAFLIADVRGYTSFTQDRGDEAAARLAARFAGLVREVVEASGGALLELRGDEGLAVFTSPRASLRAAVALQLRFVEATEQDPSLPLRVGIGLDAGEAVPVEGGFRGGALNLAARLCSRAGPGQVLASEQLTHLARNIPGIRYVEPRELRVKGMSSPVRAIEVLPVDQDPVGRLREIPPLQATPGTGPHPRRRASPIRIGAAAGVVVAGVVVAGVLLTRGDSPTHFGASPVESTRSPLPRGVTRIDAATGRVVATVSVGNPLGAVSLGGGFVWVQDTTGVAKVNPETNRQIAHVDDVLVVGSQPQGDESGLWVQTRIDPSATQPRLAHVAASTNHVDLSPGPPGRASVYGDGVLWEVHASPGVPPDKGELWRVDPRTGDVKTFQFDVGPFGGGFDEPPVDWLAVGEGAVWFLNASGTVTRLDPETGTYQQVSEPADGVAVGEGAVWLLNRETGLLTKINPIDLSKQYSRRVGIRPTALVTSHGSVWVVDRGAGEVLRVNPFDGRVHGRIYLGAGPGGIAADETSVWVVR